MKFHTPWWKILINYPTKILLNYGYIGWTSTWEFGFYFQLFLSFLNIHIKTDTYLVVGIGGWEVPSWHNTIYLPVIRYPSYQVGILTALWFSFAFFENKIILAICIDRPSCIPIVLQTPHTPYSFPDLSTVLSV